MHSNSEGSEPTELIQFWLPTSFGGCSRIQWLQVEDHPSPCCRISPWIKQEQLLHLLAYHTKFTLYASLGMIKKTLTKLWWNQKLSFLNKTKMTFKIQKSIFWLSKSRTSIRVPTKTGCRLKGILTVQNLIVFCKTSSQEEQQHMNAHYSSHLFR